MFIRGMGLGMEVLGGAMPAFKQAWTSCMRRPDHSRR